MNKYEHIISSCGFSKEMRNYLLDIDIPETTVIDIILGAPIPLTKKRELIDSMHTPDSNKFSEISSCLIEIDEALEALKIKAPYIFTLSKCWYDEDILNENESTEETFQSFQDILNYINKTNEEGVEHSGEGKETSYWTEVKITFPPLAFNNHSGNSARDFYILVGNEIYYFKRNGNTRHDGFSGYVSSLDLDLPIPFKPGDIVTLDCTPFRPMKQAVLLEVDNRDCCGVQMLYSRKSETNGEKIWETGALKHGHGWDGFFPILSSLYRLSKFEGELTEEELLMKDVRQYVLKDEGNGSKLWDFMHKSCPSETELSEYLKKNM